MDARYLFSTYVSVDSPHYDPNLAGPFLALQNKATDACSRNSDEQVSADFIGKIQNETMMDKWQWDGPEVVRTYPPDDVLRQMKPDARGIINYEYTVVLLHRDANGKVIRTESYTAKELLPLSFLNNSKVSPSKP